MMIRDISKLMLTRLKTLWKWPANTVEFPYVIRHAAPQARVSLRNNFADCIGCHKCEDACPVKSITVTTEDFSSLEKIPKSSKGLLFEKKTTRFVIDFNKCVSCGICVTACPTGSLTFDKTFVAPRQSTKHLCLDLMHRPRALRRDQGYED